MFARLPDPHAAVVTILLEGQPVQARAGDSVATALLAAGVLATRSHPANEDSRGPYCLMGACFECLVVIDGEPSRQACLVTVREGMRVERQRGARPFMVQVDS
jgi:predicted molibdopterin-dependent oxidoreductase YjgC